MTSLDFFLSLVPPEITAQQKGVRVSGGKAHHFTKEPVRDWMNAVALASAPFRPAVPLRGPVKATLTFTFPWREREKAVLTMGGWLPRDTKPDWDNLAKATIDAIAMAGFFAKGDQQIADGRVLKGWGDKPGVRVRLSEWDYQANP